MQTPLPIDAHVDAIVAHVRKYGTAIVVAPPGSGKTTRISPALTAIGKTILLQPRRVAARALTHRIAHERGWKIGAEVGWQIRFERRFSSRTQLLVATEGILTARLQNDPLLTEFRVVVLDEFHERSIHADLALALTKQAAAARRDLAIVVMSATLDAEPLAHFLSAKIFDIQARTFPIEIEYAPNKPLRDLIPASGDALVFLPGVREITRATAELRDLETLPLHGSLDVEAQERAIAPSSRRKIILSTNIAETSLTVEGVNTVIDSGLHKVLRFDPETAIDHLVLERISRDSADQRAGRAGRTGPGRALRLWDARDILRPHREPEVRRVDLASAALDIIAWGGDPKTFEWFERPPDDRLDAAILLLSQLGDLDELRRFPLHPRLARVLIDVHGADEAVEICAHLMHEDPRDLTAIVRKILGNAYRRHVDDATLRRALLAGYPDRVAMRRGSGVLLSSGTGAALAREIDDGRGEFLVVLEITGDLVRMARPIEREWLKPDRREELRDGDRIVERRFYGALLLHEQTIGRIAKPKVQQEPIEMITLPSGRRARLDYRDDGSVVVSVKLQELFGLAETPRVGPKKTPVTFELLAPNGRPVQTTSDLRSFWENTYPEIRKELRGRYPKHPWPEDPWTARPTHRTKKS
ncbi:MAG TPA: ATP-dependent helicase C-terminal domain-containing protein [Thermoanaerobaculia bacterium]|nr:ATP-dependent helicase C-terminal domain-containing protein [Thermoanaerobaculia bacterium]